MTHIEILIIVANNIRNPYNLAICKRLYQLDCVQNNINNLCMQSQNCIEYLRIFRDLNIMMEKNLNFVTIPVNRPNVIDNDLLSRYKSYKIKLVKMELYRPQVYDRRTGIPSRGLPILLPRTLKRNRSDGGIDWNKDSNRSIDINLYSSYGVKEHFELRCDKRGFLNFFSLEEYTPISNYK